MKATKIIRQLFHEKDIKKVFSLMSDGTKKLVSKIDEDEEIEVVEARHEQNAMAMADGYARGTSEIGVCIVGRGPAIAQTGTSLVTSSKNGTKLLVLVPESPLSTAYDSKGFRQEAFLETMGNEVVSIRSREVLVTKLVQTIRKLERGGGPIAVQIPWDLMHAEIEIDGEWDPGAHFDGSIQTGARLQPSDGAVTEAVDLYLDSDKSVPPVIVAGWGAYRSGAEEAIEGLAERTSAMLATTLQGRGLFADHPFSIGFVGGFGSNLANDYFKQSDYVLAIGCSLNPHTTDHGRFLEETTVVHVDIDPTHLERHQAVDIGIQGDARETARAIEQELASAGIDFSDKFWTDKRRSQIAEFSALDEREYPEQSDRVDPRDLIRELDMMLPTDRLVVADGGHFTNFVLDGMSVSSPQDFIWSLDFSSIGQGVPMGIGAATGTDDKACITFCGDSGFMMTLQELNTIAREQIPVTLIVMNDQALGSEFHQLDLADKNAAAAQCETPDFEKIAQDFGVEGHTVQSLADLESMRDRLSEKPEEPRLVDCKINRQVRHRFYLDLHGF